MAVPDGCAWGMYGFSTHLKTWLGIQPCILYPYVLGPTGLEGQGSPRTPFGTELSSLGAGGQGLSVSLACLPPSCLESLGQL